MKVDLAADSPEPGDVARIAGAAEALGFDGLWIAETAHEPFVGSALALAASRRIGVGTGIAVAFARSPVTIAQAAFDLAALSGGRFQLGLGTQVRAHVERRFGMAWSAPAPRMAEWIAAIRGAWAAWQDGAPFRVSGEHLDLSLMPKFFSPPPLAFEPAAGRPRIPVSIAGVGPGLARLAGRVADGFHVHPFHTARYLAGVIEPALAEGEARRGGDRVGAAPSRSDTSAREGAPGPAAVDAAVTPPHVERIVPVFLAPTDRPDLLEAARSRIAFYASTPRYRRVLALHGREHAGEQLSRLAAAGRWAEMPPLIDDELLAEVAVVAPTDALPDLLARRVSGHADRVMPLLEMGRSGPGLIANGLEGPNARLVRRLIATLRDA